MLENARVDVDGSQIRLHKAQVPSPAPSQVRSVAIADASSEHTIGLMRLSGYPKVGTASTSSDEQ